MIDIRGSGERGVTGNRQPSLSEYRDTDNSPSASHGKVTLSRQRLTSDVQERDRESDIAAGSRRDETCGIHTSFLSAPVGREGFIVARTVRVEDLLGERKFEGTTLDRVESVSLRKEVSRWVDISMKLNIRKSCLSTGIRWPSMWTSQARRPKMPQRLVRPEGGPSISRLFPTS